MHVCLQVYCVNNYKLEYAFATLKKLRLDIRPLLSVDVARDRVGLDVLVVEDKTLATSHLTCLNPIHQFTCIL